MWNTKTPLPTFERERERQREGGLGGCVVFVVNGDKNRRLSLPTDVTWHMSPRPYSYFNSHSNHTVLSMSPTHHIIIDIFDHPPQRHYGTTALLFPQGLLSSMLLNDEDPYFLLYKSFRDCNHASNT